MQRLYRERDLIYWKTLTQKNVRLAELDQLFTEMPELVDLRLS
jgi:hypothetical protein